MLGYNNIIFIMAKNTNSLQSQTEYEMLAIEYR